MREKQKKNTPLKLKWMLNDRDQKKFLITLLIDGRCGECIVYRGRNRMNEMKVYRRRPYTLKLLNGRANGGNSGHNAMSISEVFLSTPFMVCH